MANQYSSSDSNVAQLKYWQQQQRPARSHFDWKTWRNIGEPGTYQAPPAVARPFAGVRAGVGRPDYGPSTSHWKDSSINEAGGYAAAIATPLAAILENRLGKGSNDSSGGSSRMARNRQPSTSSFSGSGRSQNLSITGPANSRTLSRGGRGGSFQDITNSLGINMVQGNDNYGTVYGNMGGANVGGGSYDNSFRPSNIGGGTQNVFSPHAGGGAGTPTPSAPFPPPTATPTPSPPFAPPTTTSTPPPPLTSPSPTSWHTGPDTGRKYDPTPTPVALPPQLQAPNRPYSQIPTGGGMPNQYAGYDNMDERGAVPMQYQTPMRSYGNIPNGGGMPNQYEGYDNFDSGPQAPGGGLGSGVPAPQQGPVSVASSSRKTSDSKTKAQTPYTGKTPRLKAGGRQEARPRPAKARGKGKK